MVPFTEEVARSIPEGYTLEIIHPSSPKNKYYLTRDPKFGLGWVNVTTKTFGKEYTFHKIYPVLYVVLNPYMEDILWD
jgi:hypothetical protein